MKWNWQWFLGGRIMFWVATILFVAFVFAYVITFVVDPTTSIFMKIQSVDETSIREISEQYVTSLGVKINKPICYRFVKYQHERYFTLNDLTDTVLLGTFHEWNNTYFIDISVNLYRMGQLDEIVRHETRHMLVQELKNENIIDLTEHTEDIAREKNSLYNELFDCSIKLLEEEQSNGK